MIKKTLKSGWFWTTALAAGLHFYNPTAAAQTPSAVKDKAKTPVATQAEEKKVAEKAPEAPVTKTPEKAKKTQNALTAEQQETLLKIMNMLAEEKPKTVKVPYANHVKKAEKPAAEKKNEAVVKAPAEVRQEMSKESPEKVVDRIEDMVMAVTEEKPVVAETVKAPVKTMQETPVIAMPKISEGTEIKTHRIASPDDLKGVKRFGTLYELPDGTLAPEETYRQMMGLPSIGFNSKVHTPVQVSSVCGGQSTSYVETTAQAYASYPVAQQTVQESVPVKAPEYRMVKTGCSMNAQGQTVGCKYVYAK